MTWRIRDLFHLVVLESLGGTKPSFMQKILCSLLTGSSEINFGLNYLPRSAGEGGSWHVPT